MPTPVPSAADKRTALRALHASGCFVIPNPWDTGSARYLQYLGFKALATTSSGYATSRGVPDGAVPLGEALAHFQELADATNIPLNADFENGFADDPEGVAANVTRCIETGVAGLSIEDSPQCSEVPLYDFDLALSRVQAARAAIDASGSGVVLTARTEGFIRGRPDIDETIRRLEAFADAGADCLYAPGVSTREHIEAIVEAAGGRAVNVLNSAPPSYDVDDLAAMGVRRISVGGTLARVAMHGFIVAARQIAEEGTFDAFDGIVGHAELSSLVCAGGE